MATDLLLKTPSFLEEKKPDSNKEVKEIGKVEERLVVERESLMPPPPNEKDSANRNPIPKGSEKIAGPDGNRKTSSDNLQKEFAPMMDKVELLQSAKAEMGEVKEENERLKIILSRIMKDYQALQMHFFEITQQEESSKKPLEGTAATISSDHETEETELVSLSLGNSSATMQNKQENTNSSKRSGRKSSDHGHSLKRGLSLGLGCKFEESPENSCEEPKEEDQVGKGWPPTKLVKASSGAEEDVSQPAHVKKARVSVRARCDTPTMQDGCQWRKYGQKIAKGNPCPRAYYRCTVAPACPVRKQVQRCSEDMSILITTYEGTHNHPLPLQATAMASTTSAAASMLISGSAAPSGTGTSVSAGLTFDLSDSSRTRPFYLSTPAISSSPPSYPTITLDLTSTSSTPQISRLPSSFSSTTRYSSPMGVSNFNFSNDQTAPTSSWNSTSINTSSSYFNYGSSHHYSKSPVASSILSRAPHDQHFYQSCLQKSSTSAAVALPPPPPPPPTTATSSSCQQNLSDTIAAATKVIASDPSFRSALAAAITSIVGGGSPAQSGGDNGIQTLKWGEQLSSSIVNSSSYSSGGAGCGPALLNRTSSSGASGSGQKERSLLFPAPPTVPFSSTKSSSASPAADHVNREHKG